jgi:hypothetical protein
LPWSERHQDGHGFEVRWPRPECCRWAWGGVEERAHIAFQTSPQAVRDLDGWGQPSCWIDQAPCHRGAWCTHRQPILPPCPRNETASPFRFEQFVLRLLIGRTAEDVARRLGISAETVERSGASPRAEERRIDPQRGIPDIGLEELSLKKRPRFSVMLRTDRNAPVPPWIGTVARGPDPAAAPKWRDRLSEEQRRPVRSPRGDLGSADPAACAPRLKPSHVVTARFSVAKQFTEVADARRKNCRVNPLKELYPVRLRFQALVATAGDRPPAARWVRQLRRATEDLGLALAPFFATSDRWKTALLNDVAARPTSAAVAGINPKARVIPTRSTDGRQPTVCGTA